MVRGRLGGAIFSMLVACSGNGIQRSDAAAVEVGASDTGSAGDDAGLEPDAGVLDAEEARPDAAPDSGTGPDAGASDCGGPVATEYTRCNSYRTPAGLMTTCGSFPIPAECLPFPTCECLGAALCQCSGEACNGLTLDCYSP